MNSVFLFVSFSFYGMYAYGMYAYGMFAYGMYAYGMYAYGMYAYSMYDFCNFLIKYTWETLSNVWDTFYHIPLLLKHMCYAALSRHSDGINC